LLAGFFIFHLGILHSSDPAFFVPTNKIEKNSVTVLACGWQQRAKQSQYRPSPHWGEEENGKKAAKNSWVETRAV